MPVILGSDGYRARDSGMWAERKLAFLNDFGPSAIDATWRKRRRFYVDLFAGPGLNVDIDGGRREFFGSPLRVLTMRGNSRTDLTFTDAILVNQNSLDHDALERRVTRLSEHGDLAISRDNVQVLRGDANAMLPDLMRAIHVKDYVFVFADIEAPKQWPWTSVEALTERGHGSVDLYTLFPLEMGINRLLAYEKRMDPASAGTLDRYFGTDSWRDIVNRRRTPAQAAVCRRELVELYAARLATRWKYSGSVMNVRLRGNQGLYRMLFASNHEAADRIAAWAKKRAERSDQGTLL